MYTVKEGLTVVVVSMRNMVASLLVDLDNIVAVQNDCASLNQLQLVELENFLNLSCKSHWFKSSKSNFE